MIKKIKAIVFVIILIGLSISLQSLMAAWLSPTADAPLNNTDAPISIGSSQQLKKGSLILNTDGNQNGLVVPFGNVGLGTIFPEAKLDVNGEVRMGYTGLLCVASSSGAIRYNSVLGSSQFCDGSKWKTLLTDADRDGIVDWNDWDDNDVAKKHINLQPGNIASGTTIFGVTGTLQAASCPSGWISAAGYCVSPEFGPYNRNTASTYCASFKASVPSVDTFQQLKGLVPAGNDLWTSNVWAGNYDGYGYVAYWYTYNLVGTLIGGGGAWTNGIPSGGGNTKYVRCVK